MTVTVDNRGRRHSPTDRLWGWLVSGTPVNGVSVQILCSWDLIKWSLARGLALDLGGAPNDGIRELKTSLGADLEHAVRVLQFHPAAAYKTAAALRNWGRSAPTGPGCAG